MTELYINATRKSNCAITSTKCLDKYGVCEHCPIHLKKVVLVPLDHVLEIVENEPDCGSAWNMQRAIIDDILKLKGGAE